MFNLFQSISFINEADGFLTPLIISLQLSWMMQALILCGLFAPSVILFIVRFLQMSPESTDENSYPMLFQFGYVISMFGAFLFNGLIVVDVLFSKNIFYTWTASTWLADMIIIGAFLKTIGNSVQIRAFEKQRAARFGSKPGYVTPFSISVVLIILSAVFVSFYYNWSL